MPPNQNQPTEPINSSQGGLPPQPSSNQAPSTPPTPQQPKTATWKKVVLIVLISLSLIFVLLIVIGVIASKYGYGEDEQTEGTINDGQTQVLNLQEVPQNHTEYQTNCYKTIVPDPITIKEEDCALVATFSGTELPYVRVYAITDGPDNLQQAANDFRKSAEEEAKKYELSEQPSPIEEVQIHGQTAYTMTQKNGVENFRNYLIGVPAGKSYVANNGQNTKYFLLVGYDQGNDTDVFTKEYKTFVDNFQFR